jgi:hypothetical protein
MTVIATADMFRRGGNVQQIDSQYQFDPKDWATYEAARVQADAAIEAAKIGAKAAKDAADLQLDAAIIAALVVLVAAIVTYWASMNAAKRQTKLEKEKHDARVAAYAVNQRISLLVIKKKAVLEANYIEKYLKAYKEHKLTKKHNETDRIIFHMNIIVQSDWENEQWENHALLGVSFVACLISAKYSLEKLNLMRENIIINSIKSDGMHNIYKAEDKFKETIGDDGVRKKIKTFKVFDVFEKYHSELLTFSKDVDRLFESISNGKYRI